MNQRRARVLLEYQEALSDTEILGYFAYTPFELGAQSIGAYEWIGRQRSPGEGGTQRAPFLVEAEDSHRFDLGGDRFPSTTEGVMRSGYPHSTSRQKERIRRFFSSGHYFVGHSTESFSPKPIDAEGIYVSDDGEEVADFLREHPQLARALREIRSRVREHFGADPRVILRLYTDPAFKTGRQLAGFVVSTHSVDEALARLDDLDKEWYSSQPEQITSLFNFNVAIE
jgi:hypothetical protein